MERPVNPRTALYEKIETLQNMLINKATGRWEEVRDDDYPRLRKELLADRRVRDKLPELVRTFRDLSSFWDSIKHQAPTYHERRGYLRAQFSPVLDYLEQAGSPADQPVSDVLAHFDTEHVHRVWARALDRRSDDPEGAITSARTLLESVCKHILDESGQEYNDDGDLPRLYRLTSEVLALAPNQQSEDVFRRIFGGCQAVVENLGALRNKLSDAHGRGKKLAKPQPRHAQLAVNLAGAMATFLVETWEDKTKSDKAPE